MWSLMQELKTKFNLSWRVMGDSNVAMWSFEHFIVTPRNENPILAFRDVLQVCELSGLGSLVLLTHIVQ